jgi:hypothetical protein
MYIGATTARSCTLLAPDPASARVIHHSDPTRVTTAWRPVAAHRHASSTSSGPQTPADAGPVDRRACSSHCRRRSVRCAPARTAAGKPSRAKNWRAERTLPSANSSSGCFSRAGAEKDTLRSLVANNSNCIRQIEPCTSVPPQKTDKARH